MSSESPTSLLAMRRDTNKLTDELEDRIKHLISGYEYLDRLSTAVPHDLQDAAAQHRKILLDVVSCEDMAVSTTLRRMRVFILIITVFR